MRAIIVLAGIVSLGCISASFENSMDRCMQRASFDVCHQALNR